MMGASAKAILFGDISHEQVAAAIRDAFPSAANDMRMDFRDANGSGRIIFPEPQPVTGSATHRMLSFMPANIVHEHNDIYSGTRTVLDLSKWGSSTEILMAILERFGGYLLESDTSNSRDPDNWKRIDAKPGFEASDPKDRLKIELARAFPAGIATQLAALADDDQAMDKVLDAFNTFKQERDILSNLKVDAAEPELEFDSTNARVEFNFGAGADSGHHADVEPAGRPIRCRDPYRARCDV